MPLLKVTDTTSSRTRYEFDDFAVTIGRSDDNLIHIEDAQASRHHAEIRPGQEGWWLHDLDSLHGVIYKGHKLSRRMLLADGDEFFIAGYSFIFMGDVGPDPVASETHVNKTAWRYLRFAAAMVITLFAAWFVIEHVLKPQPPSHQQSAETLPLIPKVGVKDRESPPVLTDVALPTPPAPAVASLEMKEAKPAAVTVPVGSDLLMRSGMDPLPPMLDGHITLFKPDADLLSVSRPVLSPDARHVLHYVKTRSGPSGMFELMFNQRMLALGMTLAAVHEMRFSQDGSSWMVLASLPDGNKALIMPDRHYMVQGSVEALLGSHDFSTVAYVARSEGESCLYLNGDKISSYNHIRQPQLSADGKHWAYVAVKNPQRAADEAPSGERVVTDHGSGPIHDEISDLRLSFDGSRLAYIAHREFGSQILYLDGRALYVVPEGKDERIRELAFAPAGQRFAWLLLAGDGSSIFNAEGRPPLRQEPPSTGAAASLFHRETTQTRIIFSPDGRHVACAIAGRGALLARDDESVHRYPALALDSLTYSHDGKKLAYVSFHPLKTAASTSEGLRSQPHAAVLNLEGMALSTIPVAVHQSAGAFPIIMGGYSHLLFSPVSSKLAALVQAQPLDSSASPLELHIQGKKAWRSQPQQVLSYSWESDETLLAACHRDGEVTIRRIKQADQ